MTGNVLLLASAKGGVGKSTVALGVSRALVERGKRVLLVDLDFHNPCLDLLCGVENQGLYTLADAAAGTCQPMDACLRPDPGKELYLLPAGTPEGALCAESAKDVIKAVAEATDAAYILMDTGAGKTVGLEVGAALAKTALIVAGHSPTSIRAAERTGAALFAWNIPDVRMVINSFDPEGAQGQRSSMLQIADGAHLPLSGVIPYDYCLLLAGEGCGSAQNAAAAFQNIADRLLGKNVPLFHGIPKLRRQRKRLFR